MKIAVLAYSFIPGAVGGAQIFTFNLLLQLAKRTHQVDLYLPRRYAREAKTLLIEAGVGFNVHPLFWYENSLAKFFPALLSWILHRKQKKENYKVWQIIGAYPAGYIAKNLSQTVPVVLRSYGSDIQKAENLNYGLRLNPKIEKRIADTINKMTSLVALTPTVRDCYLELGGKSGRIVEISNAVDCTKFHEPVDREYIRKKLNIPPGKIFILTTGRYHIKKGYEFIPLAAKILAEKGYPILWLIVGKKTTSLQKWIDKHNAGNLVRTVERFGIEKVEGKWSGTLEAPSKALIELYKSADLYVLPSLLETFGMVLIEAMACGLPIVSTDAPGCRDVIEQGVNGLRAKPSDSADLAACIDKILSDSKLKENLKRNSLLTVEKYDWKVVCDRYESLYTQLAK